MHDGSVSEVMSWRESIGGDSHPWRVRSKQPLVRCWELRADRIAIARVEKWREYPELMYDA